MDKKWRFISNQNSTINGINDAGIETFSANICRSCVRESIQNSLDVKLDGNNNPVLVEFSLFDMRREDIPDIKGFETAISQCKQSNSNEPDALKFFTNAEKVIKNSTISVLRISDHNTTGLEGSDTAAKGTSWSRLIKESGSSNKGDGSGGSFGIGKAAPFACSDLRTVFYSSKDSKGLLSNIGVTKLVSFEDSDLGWTTGVGYYSEDNRFLALQELASFDKSYSRMDSGTDVYVIGMHRSNDLLENLKEAVLLDFLVSLVTNKLVVKIQDEVIDSASLPRFMSKLNPHSSEEIRDLLEYYSLLTSHDPRILKIPLNSNVYGKKYGFEDGECTLYLKESDGLNRKIMITRRAGMRILEQNRISGSIEFTGVLIIDGNNMNAAFKKMEVPSHDAWEPGRVRGEESKYKKILDDLKKYLRDVVKENFGKVSSTAMDAFGASDFLPDAPEEDAEDKLAKDPMSTRVKTIDEKEIIPTNKSSRVIDIDDSDSDTFGGGGKGPEPNPNPDPKPHPGPGPGPEPGPNPGPGQQRGDESKFRKINIKKRLICTDSKKGKYVISMIIPSDASKAKLVFTLSGEQSEFDLPIGSANVISGESAEIDAVESNVVYLNNLKKNKQLKIEVDVDFNNYCMMEVDYYAYKK